MRIDIINTEKGATASLSDIVDFQKELHVLFALCKIRVSLGRLVSRNTWCRYPTARYLLSFMELFSVQSGWAVISSCSFDSIKSTHMWVHLRDYSLTYGDLDALYGIQRHRRRDT